MIEFWLFFYFIIVTFLFAVILITNTKVDLDVLLSNSLRMLLIESQQSKVHVKSRICAKIIVMFAFQRVSNKQLLLGKLGEEFRFLMGYFVQI